MRIQPLDPLKLGQIFRDFAGRFAPSNQETGFSHNLAGQVEETFHKLSPHGQRVRFQNPAWLSIRQNVNSLIPRDGRNPPDKVQGKTYPIVPGFKEGIDAVLKIVSDRENVSIPEIGISKGGLASTLVEALSLFDTPAFMPSLHGNLEDPLSNLHLALMESAGIDTSLLIHTEHGAYLHTCFYVIEDGNPKEFWMAPKREPFNEQELARFTDKIRITCEGNKKESLVLSSHPPTGSGNDYFSRLVEIGLSNENVIVFNPKEYDLLPHKHPDFLYPLFLQGKINLLKPNLNEFVQLLRYSFCISESEEKVVKEQLYQDIEKGRLDNLFDLGKKLLTKLDKDCGILIISLGKHGAVIMNEKYGLYSRAPVINFEKGCPSGAGDSGLAASIIEARDRNITFKSRLNDADLRALLHAFIYGASATASLPGNEIAGPEIVGFLKQQDLWMTTKQFHRY